jgi:hypothetical protein
VCAREGKGKSKRERERVCVCECDRESKSKERASAACVACDHAYTHAFPKRTNAGTHTKHSTDAAKYRTSVRSAPHLGQHGVVLLRRVTDRERKAPYLGQQHGVV